MTLPIFSVRDQMISPPEKDQLGPVSLCSFPCPQSEDFGQDGVEPALDLSGIRGHRTMDRSTILNGKTHEISMAMFNSYVTHYQRVSNKTSWCVSQGQDHCEY